METTTRKDTDATIKKLLSTYESQKKTMDTLIKTINENKSSKGSNRKVKKRTKKTFVSRDSKTALDQMFKDYHYDMFLDGLKQIGRPAMTKEIADRIRKNPKYKKITRNKKRFMQFMYSSVSHLFKSGELKRKPVGKKSFEYSLKSWKTTKANSEHKMAA